MWVLIHCNGVSLPAAHLVLVRRLLSNRQFEFDKRSQLFIRSRNQTLSIACGAEPYYAQLIDPARLPELIR